jgi:hypothetical protein
MDFKIYYCYSLDLKSVLRAHMLKAWSLIKQCSEAGALGGNWIMRAPTSSMD